MPRNYKKETAWENQPGEVKRRMARNRARAAAERAGLAKKGDGKEVDHKDGNPMNNSKSNLRVVKKSANRKKQPAHKGKKLGRSYK